MKMATGMCIAMVAAGSEEVSRKVWIVRSHGFSQVCMNGDTLRHARRSEIVVDHRARDLSEVRPNVRPHDLDRAHRLLEDIFGCSLWMGERKLSS
jgi:hypothetical protein